METFHYLTVEELDCSSCEASVASAVKQKWPRAKTEFDLSKKQMRLIYNQPLKDDEIMACLTAAGYRARIISPKSTKQPFWSRWFSQSSRTLPWRQVSHNHEESAPENTQAEFRATFSIGGMSCASCARSITTQVQQIFSKDINQFSVDLLGARATVLLTDKLVADKIQAEIQNMGYECRLQEILPVSTSIGYKIVASIGGMTCAACSNAVQKALTAESFVKKASIDPLGGSGEIFVSNKQDEDKVRDIVESVGYSYTLVKIEEVLSAELQSQARTLSLAITGMFCPKCPDNVMRALKTYGEAIEVIDAATLENPYVRLTYLPEPPKFAIRSIIAEIEKLTPELKYDIVKPKSLEELAADHLQLEGRAILVRLIFTALIALPATIMMFVPSMSLGMTWFMLVLATPVYFWADSMFHQRSFHEIMAVWSQPSWYKRFFQFGSMNLLMSMATSISYWASIIMILKDRTSETYFDSVIFLTLFLLIGRYLDVYSKGKTSSSVSELNKLKVASAELVQGSETETVPCEYVEVGDTIKVFSGRKIPVDGIITSGRTQIDESMLTGESMPVNKQAGDQVYTGTINTGSETCTVKVTAIDQTTLLEGIMQVVRQAQFVRAPIERVAEKVTGVFVPVVTYLALLVWLFWYVMGISGRLPREYLGNLDGWGVWSMSFALAVFVVACPCGIGLAAPTALFVGSRLASKYGILARGGGEAFQEGSKIDVVCFDKTGTITYGGDPSIQDSWFKEGYEEYKDELVQLAALLETDSVHPLARAVTKFAGHKAVATGVEDIRNLFGRGIQGRLTQGPFSGKRALFGNEKLLQENQVSLGSVELDTLAKWKSEVKSVILLAIDQTVVMMVSVSDQIRPEAQGVVQSLQKAGIQTWMITGDNVETARVVAEQVGIPQNQVIAEVLPEEKAERVKWLQKVGNAHNKSHGRAIVAFVGDGVNDAPSLSVSDVGVALGAGADVAISCAQFIIMRDDLQSILVLCALSRAVIHRIKLNFFFSGIYNAIAVPVAAGALLPLTGHRLDPVFASLAMAFSSVSVVLSSMRLGQWQYK